MRVATISSCGEFRRVTFIPHKELSLIPYWALASEWPDVRISIVPGANVYRLLLERQRQINGERVALGDATGSLAGVATELDRSARDLGVGGKLEPDRGTLAGEENLFPSRRGRLLHRARHQPLAPN